MRSHRIRQSIISVLCIIVGVANAVIDVSSLPNFGRDTEFFSRTVRETAFNELHRSFERNPVSNRQQEMNMVGHDDELMNLKFLMVAIGKQSC